MTALPSTIPEYLRQLRHELRDADPAMLQDALYDAEEYLRSALAEQPGRAETEVLAEIASSYGAPAEVADIYRTTEVTVTRALRPPRPSAQPGLLKAFFGVASDPRAYAGLFYMLLSLATGIFYFTWTVTGVSLSIGLSILIIGIPFVILFLGTTRLLSLVEGRIVEVMLGERMPRRPTYTDREQPLMTRIGAMFKDPRTWSALLYLALMLPLGVVYFMIAVTGLSLGLGLVGGSFLHLFSAVGMVQIDDLHFSLPPAFAPLTLLLGVVVLFLTLHIARGVAKLHGALAKQLLVKVV
jgi:uncharacterized membrane protein